MGAAIATRPKADKKKGRKADPNKGITDTPEGEFVESWLDDAVESCPAMAAIIGTASKKEYRAFIASLVDLCEDYSEALYSDEDEDEDEDDDDEDDDEDDDNE